MRNPKVIAWAYLITGAVAILGFSSYLWIGSQLGSQDSLLDWLGLAAGIVSIGIGVRRYREWRSAEGTASASSPSQARRRIPRPDRPKQ